MGKGKAEELEALLERRIQRGDYSLLRFPSERALAVESEVSHMTARKAVLSLLDKGLLRRMPNGRLEASSSGSSGRKLAALLVPAYPAAATLRWQGLLSRALYKVNCGLRLVDYAHWEDPALLETIENFDGTFLFCMPHKIPDAVERRIVEAKAPIVSLEFDLSHMGIPSLMPFPASVARKLLDHLRSLGHRRIDCLNTQPTDRPSMDRIAQWRVWLASHGLAGELIDEPAQPFEHSFEKAANVIGSMLEDGSFKASALLCVTEGAAIGASRAFASHGWKVGKDVSVCGVNNESLSPFLTPSISCAELPDIQGELTLCAKYMREGKGSWQGPLLMESAKVSLFKGESTGPASGAKRQGAVA